MAEPRPKRPRLAAKDWVSGQGGRRFGGAGPPDGHHRAPEENEVLPKGGGLLCHSTWPSGGGRARTTTSRWCDLIEAGDVTRERLVLLHVNLLLGWDAVSAHLEEFDGGGGFEAGHGDRWRPYPGPAVQSLPAGRAA